MYVKISMLKILEHALDTPMHAKHKFNAIAIEEFVACLLECVRFVLKPGTELGWSFVVFWKKFVVAKANTLNDVLQGLRRQGIPPSKPLRFFYYVRCAIKANLLSDFLYIP